MHEIKILLLRRINREASEALQSEQLVTEVN